MGWGGVHEHLRRSSIFVCNVQQISLVCTLHVDMYM